MLCASCVVRSSTEEYFVRALLYKVVYTGNYFVQALLYEVVLESALCKLCSTK